MRQQEEAQHGTVLGGSTFLIRVQYRQNASWQGTIQWLDQKRTVPFRSMLEMMMLIQDALDQAGVAGDTPEFATWEDKEEVV